MVGGTWERMIRRTLFSREAVVEDGIPFSCFNFDRTLLPSQVFLFGNLLHLGDMDAPEGMDVMLPSAKMILRLT